MGFLAALPAIISAAGSVAGGILGSKGNKPPKFDPTPLIEERKRGANVARDLLGRIRPAVQPIGEELKRRIGEIGTEGDTRRRETANQFLSRLGKGTEAAGMKRANLLRQQILGTQPQQIQAQREIDAATGGNLRGSSLRRQSDIIHQNQAALNNLTAALDIGSQEAINTALGGIYQTEVGAQLRQQGVDEATAQFLAETGRGDVIRELAGGADIEQQKSIDIANIMQSANEADAARALALSQQRSGLLQSLIGGGSNIFGQLFANLGKGKAAGGGK